jgi:uncharacterized protein YegJ (DUF2314 family)
MLRWQMALAVSAFILQTNPLLAQTIRPDGTAHVPIGDAEMAKAMSEARARLPEFLALARNPAPTMHTFAVKVPIPTRHGNEYIWITPFDVAGDQVVGRISNRPLNITGLKEGDRLKFKTSDIVDWAYRINGRRKGNFTGRAIARTLPAAEASAFLDEMKFDPEP